jgi:hypothetical protein
VTLVRLDDSHRDPEAESRPDADILGRKERLGDMG